MSDTLRPAGGEPIFTGISSSSLPSPKKTGTLQSADQTTKSHTASLVDQFTALKGVKTIKNLWEFFRNIPISFRRLGEIERNTTNLTNIEKPSGTYQAIALDVNGVSQKLFLQTGYLEKAFGNRSASMLTAIVQRNLAPLIQKALESPKGKANILYDAVVDGSRSIIKIKYDNKTGEVTISKAFTEGGEKEVRKLIRFAVPERLSRENSILVYKRPLKDQKIPEQVPGRAPQQERAAVGQWIRAQPRIQEGEWTEIQKKENPQLTEWWQQHKKELAAEAEGRLSREFETWQKLTQGRDPVPNLVTMHSVTRTEATQKGILEPFYEGGSVDSHIEEAPSTPEEYEKRLKWAQEGATALAGMHKKGYIHSDIKPENFMIDAQGHVRLGDFGTAGLIHEGSKGSTPTYQPPELWPKNRVESQPSKKKPQDPTKADVFAFGIFLHELFYGLKSNPLKPPNTEGMSKEELAHAQQDYRNFVVNMPVKEGSTEGLHDIRYKKLMEQIQVRKKDGDSMAQLILQCINETPGKRPSMTKVLIELRNITGNPQL